MKKKIVQILKIWNQQKLLIAYSAMHKVCALLYEIAMMFACVLMCYNLKPSLDPLKITKQIKKEEKK
jgi:hypothetical protein